jgi:DNA replication protein DnaC
MSERPEYVPTDAQRALDAEVERRKAKLFSEGKANELERKNSIVPVEPDVVVSVDAVMPAIMASLDRARQRTAVFFEDVRTKMSDAPQFLICPKHELKRSIDFDLSCQQSYRADKFSPAYLPCIECEREEKNERRRSFWRKRGMPDRVIDASFKNFQADTDEKLDAIAKVRDWLIRRGNFLLLCGSTGTGKGHLAASCLRMQGAGLWIEHVNMLSDLRASYVMHDTKELVEKWQDCEMLVLDEFGLSPGGKDEEPLLYQVLADRYDKRRPTIITSNLDKPKLRDAIGYRLLDRIREDCSEISMNWPSFRTGK